MHNILSTGSSGNCVIYHKTIVVDIGIPFSTIMPYLHDIQIVLLTHEHLSDHLNVATLDKLQFERPSLRIAFCEWMYKHVKHLKNLDILEVRKWFDYGNFKISPVKLYHDVLNCGFRIIKGEHKTFHATDTSHLNGIEAKDYDLYAIESNYNEETVFDNIERIEANGGFAYQKESVNTHLSEQQANDFYFRNKKESSQMIRLHESSNNI